MSEHDPKPNADKPGSSTEEPKSTLFDFKHSAFNLKTCVFRLDAQSGQALMVVSLDSLNASIPVAKLKQSFGIDEGSPDDKLIQLLAKALKYVKEIRPGDSIPSEVLDGKASWLVDPKYLAFARAKITMQLVHWMQGQTFESQDTGTVMALADDPETKKRVQEAFGAIAEKLGFSHDRRGEVVDLVENLCRELSYIEALRDKLSGAARRLLSNLKSLQGVYARENNIADAIHRIQSILARPIKDFGVVFEEIDAGLGEILPTLRFFPQRVQYIREKRDKLREKYLVWEEILAMWDEVPIEFCAESSYAIQETYRFAASRFPQGQKWALSFR